MEGGHDKEYREVVRTACAAFYAWQVMWRAPGHLTQKLWLLQMTVSASMSWAAATPIWICGLRPFPTSQSPPDGGDGLAMLDAGDAGGAVAVGFTRRSVARRLVAAECAPTRNRTVVGCVRAAGTASVATGVGTSQCRGISWTCPRSKCRCTTPCPSAHLVEFLRHQGLWRESRTAVWTGCHTGQHQGSSLVPRLLLRRDIHDAWCTADSGA